MKISIIIATYRRYEDLKRCLESMIHLETDLSFSYNVIVVDNACDDTTKEIICSFQKTPSFAIQYLSEPSQGKCNAVNLGIKNSTADILAFTDDDVLVDSQWLKQIVNCFRNYNCDGVGGKVLPRYTKQTPQWIKDCAKELGGPIVYYNQGEDTHLYQKPQLEFLGANFSCKRDVFDKIGLFRTDIGPGKAVMGDDTEFINRMVKAGMTLYYCGQSFVWHPVPSERITLVYIARWNMMVGRYRFMIDDKGELKKNVVCWFGVPRYLINSIISQTARTIFFIFDRKKFIVSWSQLFIEWGKVLAIRKDCCHKP